MLSGELPFGEHGGLIQKSGAEIPNIPGNYSQELTEIIVRCLQKDPWDRPVAHQIVEWADNHFKGEKIVFDAKMPTSPVRKILAELQSRKNLLRIGGGVLGLLLVFMIVKSLNPPTRNIRPKPEIIIHETEYITGIDTDKLDELEPVVQEYTISTLTVDTDKTTVSENIPPAWLSEYDRIVNLAQSAYHRKDYVKAKTEYNRALALANRNGDRQKVTFMNSMIAECNKTFEEAQKALEETRKADEEALQKAANERLATYNFVGNFILSADFMIVQNKSDNRWGIINKDGTVKEAFDYTQVSTRLKDGYYALKNDKGWVVFDGTTKKIAADLEKLDDYR
jgi:hypothetical protein